ncbi:MAG: glycoside hydrolase family 25 protein [Lachnospiraceae bacterium]|nr:glycoside hydrolase family 25 protein [Lachnospiraceae bacterium]
MRLPGEEEERNSRLSMGYMVMGISLGLLLIVGVVFYANKETGGGKKGAGGKETAVMALEHEKVTQGQEGEVPEAAGELGDVPTGSAGSGDNAEDTASGQVESPVVASNGRKTMEDIEKLYRENRLTASDLDFWDMYPEGEEKRPVYSEKDGEKEAEEQARYEEAAREEAESDPSRDGKHTLVTNRDGTEEWVAIQPSLKQHSYDFTKLTKKSDKMAYYESGRKISYLGADISKENGEVDFVMLKEAGVDYVMLRLGARGYGSGELLLDEKFEDNLTKAAEAGLDIGVYFFSQAITASEAEEEAEFVIEKLGDHKITYPVVFRMEYASNDTSRIESLSVQQKTGIAKEFLDTIEDGGYKPMIYGTKEWLLKEIDLTKLTDCDVWLSQQEDMPDYPYQFQMWQYTFEGRISGITGNAAMNISFADYSVK